MEDVRVLVIDDSAFMRKVITDILSCDARIKVVDTARNGEIGLRKIKQYQPDVVTLDIEMPVMDGMDTLRKIMEENPLPVVMLSSVTDRGAAQTMEAISIGAVDFVMKPSGPISLDMEKIKYQITEKVLAAANIKKKETTEHQEVTMASVSSEKLIYDKTIIAVGTSTGGPRALQQVLTDLPKHERVPPILIVQHMPATFTKSLAERLNLLVPIRVKEANHGDVLTDNTAYIAPGNRHMTIHEVGLSYTIELTDEAPRQGHRPSVDTLFESLALLKRVNKVALILTGMGSDGALGIKDLKTRDINALIVAESEESAIIYGMPKAAINTGQVDTTLHIDDIGTFIGHLAKIRRGN